MTQIDMIDADFNFFFHFEVLWCVTSFQVLVILSEAKNLSPWCTPAGTYSSNQHQAPLIPPPILGGELETPPFLLLEEGAGGAKISTRKTFLH